MEEVINKILGGGIVTIGDTTIRRDSVIFKERYIVSSSQNGQDCVQWISSLGELREVMSKLSPK